MNREGSLFELQGFLGDSEHYHLSKNRLSQKTDLAYHRHNYFELFWVIEGKGTHVLNGRTRMLSVGDAVFLRPKDSHTFSFATSDAYVLIYNLAFFPKDFQFFKERYFTKTASFFWSQKEDPYQVRLTADQLRSLSHRANELLETPRLLFHLDRLLLYLFNLIHFSKPVNDTAPYWLQKAIASFVSGASNDTYQEGVGAFLRLCERSNAHVNRTLRSHYGQNLTHFINRLRLSRAKEELGTTNKGIKEIAFDMGFNDVNYFHKLFKAAYGVSPHKFRKKHTIVF